MLKLTANITWKAAEQGGLQKAPFSGIRPSFEVGGDLITCEVISDEKLMYPGVVYNVEIKLPYGERYQSCFENGLKFNLNVGGRVIGEGTVVNFEEPEKEPGAKDGEE